MKLIALEIPEDASDLAGWLERHLAGLDLSALVAELEAARGHESTPPYSLDAILGNQREAVLARGLASLPADRLRALLRHPRLLLDLQEVILSSGGPHWRRRAVSIQGQFPAAIDRGWDWLSANVIDHRRTPSAPNHSPPRAIRPRWRSLAVAALSAAAVVVAVVAISQRPDRHRRQNGPNVAATPGWGWNRADALPQDLPRDDYLNHLATEAEAWFKQRPDDPVALAKRITEFRQGCSVLIQSPHRPLRPDDRDWLVAQCRAWAAKLDTHLAAIQSGENTLKVRGEADETINGLITDLRNRAKGNA